METKVFFILALDALLTLVPKLVFYVSFTWWFLLASRILTVWKRQGFFIEVDGFLLWRQLNNNIFFFLFSCVLVEFIEQTRLMLWKKVETFITVFGMFTIY